MFELGERDDEDGLDEDETAVDVLDGVDNQN